ncbi:STAS domain-containing protein [Paenisporosarcina sp.]|uniref:STAS domain-containing protein n=1 Tax=Paenisporosarcina sp. TaxID=1932001 RepID=UPI003C7950AC
MNIIKSLPFPAFVVDRSFEILDMSQTARQVFGDVNYFVDLMNIGSQSKRDRMLAQTLDKPIELTLKTKRDLQELFAVSITWEQEIGILQCFEIGSKLDKIMAIVQKHENRLAHVDFELLSQKELAESHLKQIKQLSAPLIPVANNVGLVPLFGQFDQDLISNSEDRLAIELYEHDITKVVFDFNGIDQISEYGINSFKAFVETLQIMGIETYIVGLKPHHTIFMKDNHSKTATYLTTLKEAISFLT